MKVIAVIALALCAALVSAESIAKARIRSGEMPRIVGGDAVADYADFPANVVFLAQSGALTGYCGGTLIAANTILSAAHCFYDESAPSTPDCTGNLVGGGDTDIQGTDWVEVGLVSCEIHPQYDPSVDSQYDVAVITVSGFDTTTVPTMEYATLANTAPPAFRLASIAGWGTTEYGASSAENALREVSVYSQYNDDCYDQYLDAFVPATMVCAGYHGAAVDSCQGDSGGPLFTTDANDNAIVYGVVSFGNGCAFHGFYGIYASVPALLSWIQGEVTLANTPVASGTNNVEDHTDPPIDLMVELYEEEIESQTIQWSSLDTQNAVVDYIQDAIDANLDAFNVDVITYYTWQSTGAIPYFYTFPTRFLGSGGVSASSIESDLPESINAERCIVVNCDYDSLGADACFERCAASLDRGSFALLAVALIGVVYALL